MEINNYLGFDAEHKNTILNNRKRETIRLQNDSTPDINQGDFVFALISHTDGPFAVLKIMEVKTMTVREIINTTFETHKNYRDLPHFNSRMSKYYSPPFSYTDTFVYYKFRVVETDEKTIEELEGD